MPKITQLKQIITRIRVSKYHAKTYTVKVNYRVPIGAANSALKLSLRKANYSVLIGCANT